MTEKKRKKERYREVIQQARAKEKNKDGETATQAKEITEYKRTINKAIEGASCQRKR